MVDASSLSKAVAALRGRFSGELLEPNDPAYELARRVHNGLIDKRPALIARCRGSADVVDAVALSHELDLEVAVRGGGHNPAGRATVDAGLMIDLALMRGIQVDARARTVRAQGGATWGEFNRETQLHGLATTGGVVSTTGIGGLTLGGGVGWLMGKYGSAADNLVSAEMVLADGRVVTASAEENADLFWAIRGGGGNFGVAASLQYRLHQVGPTITGGPVMHPIAAARSLLRFYREVTLSLPDEMSMQAGLMHGPDGTAVAVMAVAHFGTLAEGASATRSIKQFGSPIVDGIGPLPYCDLNRLLDAAFPKGALNYWKSTFLERLSDGAIDAMAEAFAGCPSPMGGLYLERFAGAVTRVPSGDTAFPHRTPGYNFLLVNQWTSPAETDRCLQWGRETYAAMRPFRAAGRYVNYLDQDEGSDAVAAAYGSNYARLQELKAKYDPENWFHLNQNIPPQASPAP
jgi:FAD/FMN-containing dehydrogenase